MSQYWIVGEEEMIGPFTPAELKAKWKSGDVSTGAMYRDAAGNFGPISELRFLQEEMDESDVESQPLGESDAFELSPTEIFRRYTQMKSPTTAALLAIALPFVGAFYGSMAAVYAPLICAAVVGGLLISISKAMIAAAPFLFGIAYVISVIWSVNAVTEHNKQMGELR